MGARVSRSMPHDGVPVREYTAEENAALLPDAQYSNTRSEHFPRDAPYLALVSQYDADVAWAQRLHMPHVVYRKGTPGPLRAHNRAKSETNVLKYIYQFYDSLPAHLVVLHQYERKWYHRGSLVDLLNAPSFAAHYHDASGAHTHTPGAYWCFNEHRLGSALHGDLDAMQRSGWWRDCMHAYFGDAAPYGDFTLARRGCAQFVVSRERMRALPRAFYGNMYRWLVRHTLDDGVEHVGYDARTLNRMPTAYDAHPRSNYRTSRYLEYCWELLFTSLRPHERAPYSSVTDATRGIVTARWGARSLWRDVTALVRWHFAHGDALMILAGVNLRSVLFDVMPGVPKTLVLERDGHVLAALPEQRTTDLVVPLT